MDTDGKLIWWGIEIGTASRDVSAEQAKLERLYDQPRAISFTQQVDTNPSPTSGLFAPLSQAIRDGPSIDGHSLLHVVPSGATGAGSGNDPRRVFQAAESARPRLERALRHLRRKTRETCLSDGTIILPTIPAIYLGGGTANGLRSAITKTIRSVCAALRHKTMATALLPVGAEVPPRQQAVSLAALLEEECYRSARALRIVQDGGTGLLDGPDILFLVAEKNSAGLHGFVPWEFDKPDELLSAVARFWLDLQGPVGASIMAKLSDLEFEGLGKHGRAAFLMTFGTARVMLPRLPLEEYGRVSLARRAVAGLAEERPDDQVANRAHGLLTSAGLEGPTGPEEEKLASAGELGRLDDQFVRRRFEEYGTLELEALEQVRQAIEQALRERASANLEDLRETAKDMLAEGLTRAGLDAEFGAAAVPALSQALTQKLTEWRDEAQTMRDAQQEFLDGLTSTMLQLEAEYEDLCRRPWYCFISKLRDRRRLSREFTQLLVDHLAATGRAFILELAGELYGALTDVLAARRPHDEAVQLAVRQALDKLEKSEAEWHQYQWQFESGGRSGSTILLVDNQNLEGFFPTLLTVRDEATAIRGAIAEFDDPADVTAEALQQAARPFISCPPVTRLFLSLSQEEQRAKLRDLWRRSCPFLPLREGSTDLEPYRVLAVQNGADSAIFEEFQELVRDPSWDVVDGDQQEIVAVQIFSRVSLADIDGLSELSAAFRTERQAGTSLFRDLELSELIVCREDGTYNLDELSMPLAVLAAIVRRDDNGQWRVAAGRESFMGTPEEIRHWLARHPAYGFAAAYAVAERIRSEGTAPLIRELDQAGAEGVITAEELSRSRSALRRCQDSRERR